MSAIEAGRVKAAVATAAIAVLGLVATGCGDDAQDKINEAADQVQEQADQLSQDAQQAGEDIKEQAQQAADDAGDQIDEITNGDQTTTVTTTETSPSN